MILDEKIIVKWHGKTKEWYESKGYTFTKFKDEICVSIRDLQPTSNTMVNVKCDYCNITYTSKYSRIISGRKNINKDACKDCRVRKIEESNMLIYGVKYTSQNRDISDKMKSSLKFSYIDVENFVNENSDCKLLSSTYKNTEQTLRFRCGCGNEFKVSFHAFKYSSQRHCKECGIKLRTMTGENNPQWRGGVTSEAQKIRCSLEYKQWRYNVFKRDNFTCQCCKDSSGGNLRAHHINNFSSNPTKRFDINNGITLCSNCHDANKVGSFHYIYGTRNNDLSQLSEYIDIRRGGTIYEEISS